MLLLDRGAVRSITFVANSKAKITFVQQGTKTDSKTARVACVHWDGVREWQLRRRDLQLEHTNH
jgi:hypothetical protein